MTNAPFASRAQSAVTSRRVPSSSRDRAQMCAPTGTPPVSVSEADGVYTLICRK